MTPNERDDTIPPDSVPVWSSPDADVAHQRTIEGLLRDSEQRFGALADNIAQFAWLADPAGKIFWYNRRWFDYTGTSLDTMAGWGWKAVHHPAHVERVVDKWKTCLKTGDTWEDTFPIRAADGSFRWFLSRALPVRDGENKIVLWCGTNTDVTDQRNASVRLRQQARLIELSHEAIMVWDMLGGILTWNQGCVELYGFGKEEAIGAISHELLQTRHSTPISEFEKTLMREGAWTGELLHRAKNGAEVWVESRQEMSLIGGRNVVLETNRDITDRRRATQARELLIAELNHRVKNTLAIVQAMAAQTARTSVNLQQFETRFNGRLQSLASAHDTLTDACWTGADLRGLIQSQLGVSLQNNCNVDLSGADVLLDPPTAIQLTLLLHELTTNAQRHGALSTPVGRVTVAWHIVEGAQPKVELVWTEAGGPKVSAPAVDGFGLTLIKRTGQLPHIKSQIHFEPGGVRCLISVFSVAKGPERHFFNPFLRTPSNSLPKADNDGGDWRATVAPLRVLIIDDDPLRALEIDSVLSKAGFLTHNTADSVFTTSLAISKLHVDVAVIDGNLRSLPVDDVLGQLKQRGIPFVVLAGTSGIAAPGDVASNPIVNEPVEPAALINAVQTAITPTTKM